MKKSLFIFIVLGLVFLATSATKAHAAITLDTHNSTDSGDTSAESVSVTLTNVTAGDLITCGYSIGDTGGSATVTGVGDNENGSYAAAIAPVHDPTVGQWVGISYFANSTSGTIIITATSSVFVDYRALMCAAWKGAATSSVLDATSTNTQTNTANASAPAETTSANGELIFGNSTWLNTQFPTAGGGFALLDQATSTYADTEYQVQSTAGSIATTWGNSSDDWTVQMATFEAAAAPTSPPTEYWFNGIINLIGTFIFH